MTAHSHVSMQPQIDLYSKVREIEVMMIDIKAMTERKLKQFLEEVPSKMSREMQNVQ